MAQTARSTPTNITAEIMKVIIDENKPRYYMTDEQFMARANPTAIAQRKAVGTVHFMSAADKRKLPPATSTSGVKTLTLRTVNVAKPTNVAITTEQPTIPNYRTQIEMMIKNKLKEYISKGEMNRIITESSKEHVNYNVNQIQGMTPEGRLLQNLFD